MLDRHKIGWNCALGNTGVYTWSQVAKTRLPCCQTNSENVFTKYLMYKYVAKKKKYCELSVGLTIFTEISVVGVVNV